MQNARCNEETAGRPGVIQMSDEARTVGTDGEGPVRMNERVYACGEGEGEGEGRGRRGGIISRSQGVCSSSIQLASSVA